MIGGIYCEIPLGEFYDKSIADSVRWRLRKYLGVTIKGMTNQELDDTIADTIYNYVDSVFNQRRGITYQDKTYALAQSHGFAIFQDGEWERRKRKENFGKPQEPRKDGVSGSTRFYQFVNEYEPLTKKGWMVLLLASTPYATRLEVDYGRKVLMQMTNSLASIIRGKYGRKGSEMKYGYIFETTGSR